MLIFEGTPQIIVQRCQIAAPWWPNDINSAADNTYIHNWSLQPFSQDYWPNFPVAADNAIFKNRAQNVDCSFGCVARSAVLLKPNVANILLFHFCEQKCVQHSPITIAINCNGLSLLIFEEAIVSPGQNPHQTVTRFGCVGFSMLQFCLFTYPPRSKWASSEKMICFLPKSAFSVSRSQAHLAKRISSVYTTIFVRRKHKTKYLSNQTWAKCYHSRNNY